MLIRESGSFFYAGHEKHFLLIIWGMQHKLRLIPGGMVSPFGRFRPGGLMISAGE